MTISKIRTLKILFIITLAILSLAFIPIISFVIFEWDNVPIVLFAAFLWCVGCSIGLIVGLSIYFDLQQIDDPLEYYMWFKKLAFLGPIGVLQYLNAKEKAIVEMKKGWQQFEK